MFIDLDSLNKFYKYWEYNGDLEMRSVDIDVQFKASDSWLNQAIIIDVVMKRGKQWLSGLIFAKPDHGTEFVMRHVQYHTTQKSAEKSARFLKRIAQKDPKGTFVLSEEAHLLFDN